MFKELWHLMLLYLVLGVEGEDPPADDPPADDPPADDPPADDLPADELPLDGDLDSLIDNVDPPADDPPKGGRENAAIRDARARAQVAEEARIRAEATLEAERRMRQGAAPNEEQLLFEQEEAKLRNTDVSETEKWQIRSNRTLRANTRAANDALNTAADMRDRNEFDRLQVSNPKVHKLYDAKVEKALADMRAKGQNAPRLALLRFMIGNDVMEGKLKSTPKTAAANAKTSTVDRGKPPGARSDVAGKGKATERQKRVARLENVAL